MVVEKLVKWALTSSGIGNHTLEAMLDVVGTVLAV
jgi:hypothetical protein